MKTLVAIVKALGPEALEALIDLAKMAVNGSSAEVLAQQAQKLAHCVAYEKALAAARKG
jgi:hypothetical protein